LSNSLLRSRRAPSYTLFPYTTLFRSLIGQISGSLGSDAGAILFEGLDITHASQHARVRSGLARSYQVTSMFKRFTVLDNLALAVDRKSTRLNSSHVKISYAVFCLKKK